MRLLNGIDIKIDNQTLEVGMRSLKVELSENTSTEELLQKINELNTNPQMIF